MRTGQPGNWRTRLAVAALAVAVALAAAWLILQHRPAPGPRPSSQALTAAIVAGRPGAVAEARAAFAVDPTLGPWLVAALLRHETWPGRAAGCQLATAVGAENWVPALVARASDENWQVRTAAFESLATVRPLAGPSPLKDTPLADRERLLLAWLDGYQASRGGIAAQDGTAGRQGMGDRPDAAALELCEIYAAVGPLEFGPALVERCLACHGGRSPASPESNLACAPCHPAEYARWSVSRHATNLAQLRLRTVNARTRQPELVDFGGARGLGCTTCHQLRAEPLPQAPPIAGLAAGVAGPAERCPFTFNRDLPAEHSCQRCHLATTRQWRQWLTGRQPRRASWPPGQLSLETRGDQRTCVDCHLLPLPEGLRPSPQGLTPLPGGPERTAQVERPGTPVERPAALDHRFMVWRNPRPLADGIDVRAVAVGAGEKAEWRITLTNLAGHDYPTGTRRHAVTLFAGPVGQELLVATLSADGAGNVTNPTAQAALSPGEERSYVITAPPGTAEIGWRLFYQEGHTEPSGPPAADSAVPAVEIARGACDRSGLRLDLGR